MATATVAPGAPETSALSRRSWQVGRWLTLVLYAVTLLAAVVLGFRAESYSDLQSALERGAVDEVRVVGALGGVRGHSAEVQGVTTVHLEWWAGWHRSSAEVWQASSPEALRSQGIAHEPGPHIIGDLEAELRRLAPQVQIVRSETSNGIFGLFGGWELRGASAYLPMALLVACLLVVVSSPEPRLATRAGWVWLLLSPALIVAAPAYLILGARPQIPGQWRLRGIGAFLIFVVLVSGST